MSVLNFESAIDFAGVLTFEQLQQGLGQLSLADRVALDHKAEEVFEDAIALANEYGPASKEAAAADEMVLLYSMLEQQSSLHKQEVSVPTQRRFE